MTSSAPRYLNSQEAADILRISIRTLERMRVDGTGPRFMKAGKGTRSRVLYCHQDLAAWLTANSYASTSEYIG